MTVTPIFARTGHQHALVGAVHELAESWGGDLPAERAAVIAAGLVGNQLVGRVEEIAQLLERAEELDCGALDHEARTDRAAEAEVKRLRDEALMCAQLVASLALVERRAS